MADRPSSVDPPVPSQGGSTMLPEDLQTVSRLYQKCPHLWTVFGNIIEFVDLVDERLQAQKQFYDCLTTIQMDIEMNFSAEERKNNLILFSVAVGFVERSVNLSRQIMREMGKTYITELPDLFDVRSSLDMKCLYILRRHFLLCTSDSSEFCLRLAQAGFLEDLTEDLRHIQHLSAEALETGHVFLYSLGTIHNCCKQLDVVSMVRQMDIVQYITPFFGKKSKQQLVSTVALMTLAFIVDEHQLDLIRLDAELLQYFLDNVRVAVSARKPTCPAFNASWRTDEVLFGFSCLAKNDFNKRLMVAQGTLGTLVSVLESSNGRSDSEKQSAVDTMTKFVEDPVNIQVCKMDKMLISVLKSLSATSGNKCIIEESNNLLAKLEDCFSERAARSSNSPHLAELLAGKDNMLTIMDIGEVEFVLDELKDLLATAGNSGSDVSNCLKVLQALTELAEDDVYKQQIMAMGGLDMIKAVLQRGHAEEQSEAGKTVLKLMSCQENCVVVKWALLGNVAQSADTNFLRQVAEKILQSLNQ